MNQTWYENTTSAFTNNFVIKNKSKCDVLIVGGGLAGLSLLYNLRKGDVDALLVEAKSIASGASGRNGGFCLSGWAQDYEVLLRYLDIETVRELERIAALGVSWMKKKCLGKRYKDSNFRDGVLNCYLTGKPANVEKETEKNNKLLGTADEFLPKNSLSDILLSDRYLCGIKKENAFHFHPLNFMKALARECNSLGAKISENSKFLDCGREKSGYLSKIKTSEGIFDISCKRIVFATGGYGGKELKDFRKYWLPIKTFIGVTEPLGDKANKIFRKYYGISDNRRAGNYYRILPDKRLSWGRGISAFGNISSRKLKAQVSSEIRYFYPQLGRVHIDYAWSGIMAYARHFMPYVGPISVDSENKEIYSIIGFGGHGMNTASGAALILSDFLVEGKKDYKIFNNFERKWNGGLLGPYIAELKYKYIQAKDFIDTQRYSKSMFS